MRNLALVGTTRTTIQDDSFVSAVTIDLDENVTYVATEQQTPDADVTVQVRKVQADGEYREVCEAIHDYPETAGQMTQVRRNCS